MSYKQEFERILPPLYEHGDFRDSQVKEEFYHAWDILYERIRAIKEEEVSFLEIGADKGLWSIMFFLVCKELRKNPVYVTATLINDKNDHYIDRGYDPNLFNNYDYRNLNLLRLQDHYRSLGHEYYVIDGDSQKTETLSQVKSHREKYDLVFIDGDHTYEGAKRDIELYEPLCKSTLIFHDILPKERKDFYVQVYPAIVDSGINLDREIIYEGNLMGIGMKFY
jgi:hypothetical protein